MKLQKKQIVIFGVSVISTLVIVIGLGALFTMQNEPVLYEQYRVLQTTPLEDLSSKKIQRYLGAPLKQQTEDAGAYTYYEYSTMDVSYRHQAWTDANGNLLGLVLRLPEDKQYALETVLDLYTSEKFQHFKFDPSYGKVTIIAYPLEGIAYIVDQRINKVVAIRKFNPISTKEYQELFVQRGEGTDDAP